MDEMTEEQKKKWQQEYNKNWRGDESDVEEFKKGFQSGGVNKVKDAFQSIVANLFSNKKRSKID